MTPVTNLPPAIVGFTAEPFGNGLFLVSGIVIDANPGGLAVTFGGSTSARGQTVTTNANGIFSGLVQLRTDGTDTGFLSVTTIDSQNLESQSAQVFVDPTVDTAPPTAAPSSPPVIVGFEDEEVGNGLFLISGTVVDESPGNLIVTFGGGTSANGLTVTTNGDGSFSRTIQLRVDGTDSGFLTATTVDGQGLASQPVQVFLDPTTP